MARIYTIDLSKLPAYEAGATLLTLRAYPGAGERDKTLGAVHRALCDLGLWFMSAADLEWASTPQPIRPVYALRDPRETRKSLRSLERRLRDRMNAARIPRFPVSASDFPGS